MKNRGDKEQNEYEAYSTPDYPNQTPQSTFDEKLQEAMYQNVQITALGNFPEAVPDHKNWVNIMGQVFSLDFNQAKAATKALVLEELPSKKPESRIIESHGFSKTLTLEDNIGYNQALKDVRSIIIKGQ